MALVAHQRTPSARPAATTAASRLRTFLDCHPDARWRFTRAEVARATGVSPQRALVLLPRWTQERQRLQAARVRAFARTHPEARAANTNKRQTWSQIAVELDL